MSSSAPVTRPAPIPVVVLTGFLGAGKTTLLNRVLKDPALAGTAVIINEFGEIGLDHLLVDAASDGIVELSSGCLCCTIRGDLVRALEDLLRGLDNGRIGRLTRVVIETTGLADPAPILHTILQHPYFTLRYRLEGVVTMVDAINGLATLDSQSEAVKQAAVADRIVLTKTDLATDADARAVLAALRRRLAAIAPTAEVIEASTDGPGADVLAGMGLWDEARKINDVGRWLAEEAHRHGRRAPRQPPAHHDHAHGHHHHEHHGHGHDHDHDHDHDRGHDHDHDPNRHGDRIRAFALATDTPVPAAAVDLFLDLLRAAHGPKLLRMKGIVCLADDPGRPLVLHVVQHVMHPPARLPAWPDADHRTRLVFITRDLEEAFVRRMFDAFVNAVGVDTPDRAAMTDNPLAISGFSGGFRP